MNRPGPVFQLSQVKVSVIIFHAENENLPVQGFQFSICNTSNNFEFADGLPQLPNVPRPGLGDHDARPGVFYTFMIRDAAKKPQVFHGQADHL